MRTGFPTIDAVAGAVEAYPGVLDRIEPSVRFLRQGLSDRGIYEASTEAFLAGFDVALEMVARRAPRWDVPLDEAYAVLRLDERLALGTLAMCVALGAGR